MNSGPTRRAAIVGLALGLAVAACSDGGGSSGDSTAPSLDGGPDARAPTTPPDQTAATDPLPATTPPTTEAPTPPTTEPPLPEPASRTRLVVTGPEEVVFDWTTDQCEPAHIPDIASRAYRDAEGRVQLTIGHWNTYRMIGPTLDEVVTDCSTVQLRSDFDPDPSTFNDSEWIGSPYTLDGQTVYAVVHNEYRGDTHRGARPGQCPSGRRLSCLDTSFTMAISTDGGDTYDDIAEPPGQLIATLPYTYLDDTVPSGIRQPSNLIEGPDGFYYLFGNVSDQPDERQWVCAMRTDDLADPAAWRFWDGADFAGEWKNPYLEPVDPDRDKCAPLADQQLAGSVQESVVFDAALERYVMVGVSSDAAAADPRWGVFYSTSEDLIHWTTREFLLELPVNANVADPVNDTVHAYPAIIDPDSGSLNFSTSDGEMYLYMSRFNFGGGSLDRDLLRWPIAVEEFVVPAPDWTFDGSDDVDPATGGWTAVNDLDPLAIADGALQLRPTGPDPYMETGSVVIPAEYDRVVVRSRVPEGAGGTAQLFYITEDDPLWSEAKSVLFDIRGTGEFVDHELDLSGEPGWTGTIRALRLDPVAGDATAVDRIWFPTAAG